MAIEDNPVDMWGYDVNGGWGTAAGHPKTTMEMVARQALTHVRAIVMARVLDEEVREEILVALAAVYRSLR